MKRYQKNVLQAADQLLEYMKKEYTLKPINLNEIHLREFQVSEEIAKKLKEIKETIFQNNKNIIVTNGPIFSEVMMLLLLSKRDLFLITLDILNNDINILEDVVQSQRFYDEDLIKELLYQGVHLNRIQYLIEEAKASEIDKLSNPIKKTILQIRNDKKNIKHIRNKYFKLRDHYFRKVGKFSKEDFEITIQTLKDIGIQDELLEILTKELEKEIIEKVAELNSEIEKEEKKQIPTPRKKSAKKVQLTYKENSVKEQNRIDQEIQKKKYYDLKNEKPIRGLKLSEKLDLLDLLVQRGSTKAECQKILKEIEKKFPTKENFDNKDLLEKVELVEWMKSIFYSDQKIKETLYGIKTGLTRNNRNLTKKENMRRKMEIYRLFLESIKYHEVYDDAKSAMEEFYNAEKKEIEWINSIRESILGNTPIRNTKNISRPKILEQAKVRAPKNCRISNISNNKKELVQVKEYLNNARQARKEKEDWEKCLNEWLEDAYRESNYDCEIMVANQRLKQRK